jgi:signal peptidase I
MLSLAIWTILLVSQVLLTAAAVAWAARAVGSPRGRLGVGLLVVLGLMGLGVIAFVLLSLVPSGRVGVVLAFAVLVAQVVAAYFVHRRAFRLSARRAFAPFAAYFGVPVAFLGFGFGVIRPFVTEAFSIPTKGMAPTLEAGDRISVNKLLTPRRWDLVAYRATERDWQTDAEIPVVYCKRLVGLPGERLRFEGGQVYVNDQRQPAPGVVAGRYTMSLPFAQGNYRDGETIQLGPTEIFLLGDNVDHSGDSRVHGPSDRSQVVGVVDLRYWPADRISVLR